MVGRISRRHALAAGAGFAAAAPYVLRAQNLTPIVVGTIAGGWTEVVNLVLFEKGFDVANGLKFNNFNTYSSVANYYADVAKGTIEQGIGAWESYAKMYQKGAPVRLASIVTTGSMIGFFAKGDGPNSLAELKGKTLSAMQASGAYAMTKTFVRKFDNIEFEKDVEVQNVPNPPATITLVAGDRAAAAHSWEHSLSAGLHKIPGSKVFLNVGDYYKKHTGREMPYFCAVVREDALAKHPPGTLQKINKTYADVFAWIHSHEAEFAEQAAKVKLEPDVLRTAMNSGRMRFQVRPMTETKNRDDVKFCADFLFESGGLEKKLDDGYFIG